MRASMYVGGVAGGGGGVAGGGGGGRAKDKQPQIFPR